MGSRRLWPWPSPAQGKGWPSCRKVLPSSETAELPPHRPSSEQHEQQLRARYVADELSLEEYERELDRLYRRR